MEEPPGVVFDEPPEDASPPAPAPQRSPSKKKSKKGPPKTPFLPDPKWMQDLIAETHGPRPKAESVVPEAAPVPLAPNALAAARAAVALQHPDLTPEEQEEKRLEKEEEAERRRKQKRDRLAAMKRAEEEEALEREMLKKTKADRSSARAARAERFSNKESSDYIPEAEVRGPPKSKRLREKDLVDEDDYSEFLQLDYSGPRKKSSRRGGDDSSTMPFQIGELVRVMDNDTEETVALEGIVLRMEKKDNSFAIEDKPESEEDKLGKWWARVLHIDPPKNKAEEGAIKLYHLRHFRLVSIPNRNKLDTQQCAKLTAMHDGAQPSNLKLKETLAKMGAIELTEEEQEVSCCFLLRHLTSL